MLFQTIQGQISAAVKSGDALTRETLRFLVSAVRNTAIAKYGSEAEKKLTDADVLDVVKKQVKTHKESIEAFTKAGRTELAQNEQAQLAILESYLPKQLSDEELKDLLAPVAASGLEFGPLMGKAMAAVAGRADGGRVQAILKALVQK